MADEKLSAREFARWLVDRRRGLLIVALLAPVLGPGIAVFCLAGGAYALTRSGTPKVAQRISRGEMLDALIAAVLPAALYGCTVWGLQVLIQPSGWAGWIPVLLVAGLVTLVVGVLPAIYIFGYSWGVAEAKASPPPLFEKPRAPRSLGEEMLSPFRQRKEDS